MSYGLNKVMLIGHLGSDPEMKYTSSGTAVTSFNIATNESYKNQDGTMVERTEWHRIVAWRQLAEIFNQHLKKGSKVYLEGKLQTRTWDDKDGNKRYTTEIVVDDFMFLDSRGSGNAAPREHADAPAIEHAPAQMGNKEDDLPF